MSSAQCRLRRRTVVSAGLASPPGKLSSPLFWRLRLVNCRLRRSASPQISVLADWRLRCFVIFDCHFQYSVVSAESASPQIGVSAVLASPPSELSSPQIGVSAVLSSSPVNCRLRLYAKENISKLKDFSSIFKIYHLSISDILFFILPSPSSSLYFKIYFKYMRRFI